MDDQCGCGDRANLHQLRGEFGQRLAEIRGELIVLRTEWDSGHKALIERVTELEAWQTWATRLILALVITAVIAAVVAGPLSGR